jgi:hypothetical protein
VKLTYGKIGKLYLRTLCIDPNDVGSTISVEIGDKSLFVWRRTWSSVPLPERKLTLPRFRYRESDFPVELPARIPSPDKVRSSITIEIADFSRFSSVGRPRTGWD